MERAGSVIRKYDIAPGQSVNCTIAPDDDMTVVTMHGPLRPLGTRPSYQPSALGSCPVGFWSWLFGPGPSSRPPAWSTFKDGDAFARFVEALRASLSERGHELEPGMLRSGSVVLTAGEKRREWILHRLAERCAVAPETQWAENIGATLDRFLGYASSEEDLPPGEEKKRRKRRRKKGGGEDLVLRTSTPLTPADVRVQLMSSTYLSVLDRGTSVRRPCAPGIEQVLVALFAGSEITLGPADLERLGLSEEEAWKIGSDMALASDLEGIVTTDLAVDGGGTVSLLVSNGFFLGACVLRMLERVEAERVLVTLLTWHHAVLHVVEATPSRAAVTLMADVVATLEREVSVASAEWLSPAVFCYRKSDGTFTALEIERDEALRIVAVTPGLGF